MTSHTTSTLTMSHEYFFVITEPSELLDEFSDLSLTANTFSNLLDLNHIPLVDNIIYNAFEYRVIINMAYSKYN